MRILVSAFAIVGIGLGILGGTGGDKWTVAIGGHLDGYLSPCGCSEPMMGGILRRGTALAELGSNVVYLDAGGVVSDSGPQSILKAETAAQAAAASGVAGMNLTAGDAALGPGTVLSMARLAGGKLLSSHLASDNSLGIPRWVDKGPFLIGGVTTHAGSLGLSLDLPAVPLTSAVQDFLEAAQTGQKIPLLLFDGSEADARLLAETQPGLALIVYSSTGDVPTANAASGTTKLVTPGDRGRSLAAMTYENNQLSKYRKVSLGPEVKDNPRTDAIYDVYLDRVSNSKLLEQVPRAPGDAFAGSAECIKCHADAGRIWQHSKHSLALATLEKVKHDRDPDCVRCHVVGLETTPGFRSRTETPDLANVGCESCHGAGAKHSLVPSLWKFPKVTERDCVRCHSADNSPGFDFKSYWSKIKH